MSVMLSECRLCPRRCGVDRTAGRTGFCGAHGGVRIARADLHMWEEPCISGKNGSGAVFFSGCTLRCIYCQNIRVSHELLGYDITIPELSEIFMKLRSRGAHNINLVTPTPYIPQIREALLLSRKAGLDIPVVYNTGSYENPEALKLMEGLVDIYLPDMKYFSPSLSEKYSAAPDYFTVAAKAISEMVRQRPKPVFDDGMLLSGVIVRVPVLPGFIGDTKKILRYLHEAYGDSVYISIMNQYTPMPAVAGHPLLSRRVTAREYRRVVDFAAELGIERGFLQDGESALESFIPEFSDKKG